VCAWSRLCGIAPTTVYIQRTVPSFFFKTIKRSRNTVYGMQHDGKHGDQQHQRISIFLTFNLHTFPFFRPEAVGGFSHSIRHAHCLSVLILVYHFQINILLIRSHYFDGLFRIPTGYSLSLLSCCCYNSMMIRVVECCTCTRRRKECRQPEAHI